MTFKYMDGKQVKLGDYVELGGGWMGTVVCIVDEDQFSSEYPKEEWEFLKTGILFESEQIGLLHYKNIDREEDIVLLKRCSLD